jgi:hypothetical protein
VIFRNRIVWIYIQSNITSNLQIGKCFSVYYFCNMSSLCVKYTVFFSKLKTVKLTASRNSMSDHRRITKLI